VEAETLDARFSARLVSRLVRSPIRHALAPLAFLVALGCSSSPEPQPAAPPAAETEPASGDLVMGSDDSVAAIPGSPDALFHYRFRQTLPASERFTFQDRDVSFYFKPGPSALHFQVENRQGRPVWIEWDRSIFYPPITNTSSNKVAHSSTRWDDRFRVQPATQIAGLQRYTDYVLPLDYLLDPAGADEQPHRPLVPEDRTAPQYAGKEFGVDLVFRIEDRLRTYPFRFVVVSVLPAR
jgi:hypothetical protein